MNVKSQGGDFNNKNKKKTHKTLAWTTRSQTLHYFNYLNVLPSVLTAKGWKWLSKTTREQVASKPSPRIWEMSIPWITFCEMQKKIYTQNITYMHTERQRSKEAYKPAVWMEILYQFLYI